jgi:hypothetical protein
MVHVSRAWRGFSIAAAACGLIAATVTPSFARTTSAAGPTVSIRLTSVIRPVSGHVWVVYAYKNYDTVTAKGAVSFATGGEVMKLYEQGFPYRKPAAAVPGQAKTLPTSSKPEYYAFTAKPGVATRYFVEVFASSSATTPLAKSAVETAFVHPSWTFFGWRDCNTRGNRPICHQTLKIYTKLPASAYKIESAKKWYFYFAVTLNPSRIPAPPKTLLLDNSARIGRAHRISANVFERTITFSFRVNNDGYNLIFDFCSKDTESRDGINLPGHHSCGATRTSASIRYLG